jgi:xylan 1,4-beta-xylosidase
LYRGRVRTSHYLQITKNQHPLPSIKSIAALTILIFSVCHTLRSQTTENRIIVNSTVIIDTIEPIWNGIGGASGLALTPQGERLLHRITTSSPYPFYKRIWGITSTGTAVPFTAEADWGSTNVYQVDKNGNPFYDFTLFDQILDVTLKANFIPIMHLGMMPDSLSSAPDSVPRTKFNLDKYPPKDYNKWYDLVYHIVKHCVDRYGKNKVAKWKWEVWNEPDITNYWTGTEEELHKMYDYTAAAVKAALPEGEVGGNAVTQSTDRGTPILIRFIEHCMTGKNHKNGSVGAPLDFITFHLKGTNFAIQKLGNFTSKKLAAGAPQFSPGIAFIKECAVTNLSKISAIPGTAGIPVYITEGDIDIGLNVTTTENPAVEYRNSAYHAVFQCAFAKEILDVVANYPANPVKCLVFDGLFNPGFRIFEGQRTLFTAEEIEKPVFNSYRLLGKLGTHRVKMDVTDSNSIGGIGTRIANKVQVMIYNYNENVSDREAKKVQLSVLLPSPGSYKLSHYRIDENHSNAYTIWKLMGSPFNPDEVQIKKIKNRQGLELYEPERSIKVNNGKVVIPVEMPHHSVSLFVFEPVGH